jgi:hypothetical protein
VLLSLFLGLGSRGGAGRIWPQLVAQSCIQARSAVAGLGLTGEVGIGAAVGGGEHLGEDLPIEAWVIFHGALEQAERMTMAT